MTNERLKRAQARTLELVPPSRRQWESFLQSTASGWSDYLARRARSLDSESFANELEQTERSRVEVTDKWRELITATVSDLTSSRRLRIKGDAILVITIDDADLNPHRCVELLATLRTLWHPNVAFILTGDSTLFTKTLEIHYTSIFTDSLRGVRLPARTIADFLTNPSPRSLAIHAYDKAIPPSHRFTIGPAAAEVRLAIVQQLRSGSEDKNRTPQAKILRALTSLPQTTNALPTNLRALHDLALWIQQRPDTNPEEFVLHLWRTSLQTVDTSHEVAEVLSREAQTFVGEPPSVRFELAFVRRASLLHSPLALTSPLDYEAFAVPPTGPRVHIPRQFAALLLLAHASNIDDSHRPYIHLPPGLACPAVTARPPAFTEPLRSRAIPWPTPDWQRLDQYQTMAMELRQAWGPEHDPPGLLRHFITAIYRSSFQRRISRRLSWTDLATLLFEHSATPSHQTSSSRPFRQWLLTRAPLLAAPESGLPPKLANDWLSAWRGAAERTASLSPNLHKAIRTERTTRITESLSPISADAEVVLSQIDERAKTFHYSTAFDRQHAVGTDQTRRLIRAALIPIRVVHDPMSSATTPANLYEYFEWLDNTGALVALEEDGDVVTRIAREYSALHGSAAIVLEDLARQTGVELGKTQIAAPKPAEADSRPVVFEVSSTVSLELRPQENFANEHAIRLSEQIDTFRSEISRALTEVHSSVISDEADVRDEQVIITHKAPPQSPVRHVRTLLQYRLASLSMPWTLPSWRSYLDHYLFQSYWTTMAQRALRIGDRLGQETLDALTFGHLRLLVQLFRDRNQVRSEASLSMAIRREEWRSLGQELGRIVSGADHRPMRGARFVMMQQWARCCLAWHATPESGLSADAAGSALQGFLEPLEGDPELVSRVLRALTSARHGALADALSLANLEHSNNAVHQLVAFLQKEHAEHPWHARVAPPK